MSEVYHSPPAPSSSRFAPNGDGLAAPRPGDGNFLVNGTASRGFRGGGRARGGHGPRGGSGNYRGSERRTQSVNEIPLPVPPAPQPVPVSQPVHEPYSMYTGPKDGFGRQQPSTGGSMAPPPVPNGSHRHAGPSEARYNSGGDGYRNGHAGSADVHPVVQPRADAARRADPSVNGFHGGPSDNGYKKRLAPAADVHPVDSQRGERGQHLGGPSHDGAYGQSTPSPRGDGVARRGERTPRGRGGRGMGDGVRDRPAHLDAVAPARDLSTQLNGSAPPRNAPPHLKATAPAFTPQAPFVPQAPAEHFARLSMTTTDASANTPASSSRASSGEGRPRTAETVHRTRSQPARERKPKPKSAPASENGETVEETKPAKPVAPKSSRRAAFEQQTKLTTAGDRVEAAQKSKKEDQKSEKAFEKLTRPRKEEKDDLISRLTRGLGKRPYVECPICFNSITPSQPIYCCLPPTAPPPPNLDDDAPTNYYQACYAPFHLSCIRDWADRSLAEESEKIRTNLLVENDGKVKRPEWRCPGCQKRRVDRVGMYNCSAISALVRPAPRPSRSGATAVRISERRRVAGERTTKCSVRKRLRVAWRSTGREDGDAEGSATRLSIVGYIRARRRAILIHFFPSPAQHPLRKSSPVLAARHHYHYFASLTVPNPLERNVPIPFPPVHSPVPKPDHAVTSALSPATMASARHATKTSSGRVDAARVSLLSDVKSLERDCGRHECSRICCPLSYKAKSSRVKKKAGAANEDMLVAPGEEDLHACSLTCGKWLSCGLHTCQRKDHRGACGRCLQASYDELICHCGESIIYPPVACGTTITCSFPCARPPPTCGHPKTMHSCHESSACPPCPYLTTRPCACGKDPAVKNIRCSQTIVSCGQTCGNLLSCGYHRCDKTCHKQGEGECGECTQVCGKPKRVCRHPCTSACHAPAKCPESDPCGAIVDQKCACGNLSNRTTCGASANGTGTKGESREMVQLKCNSECLVKQRNARLAEALGIKGAEGRGGSTETTEWTPELKAFAQGNWAFVKMVESALADFWKGGKPSHILPQMPASKRTFVLSLAQVYRLATDLLDAEPNRSIMIRRKIDTRIPSPLLSAAVTPNGNATGEKKTGLANLRPSATTTGGSWGKVLTPTPTASPWGSSVLSGSSTPAGSSATPAGSRAISPAVRVSRPVTPLEGHAATTMTVPVNQPSQLNVGLGLARTGSARQGVVGEVGKVEEDDWDVDA